MTSYVQCKSWSAPYLNADSESNTNLTARGHLTTLALLLISAVAQSTPPTKTSVPYHAKFHAYPIPRRQPHLPVYPPQSRRATPPRRRRRENSKSRAAQSHGQTRTLARKTRLAWRLGASIGHVDWGISITNIHTPVLHAIHTCNVIYTGYIPYTKSNTQILFPAGPKTPRTP